MGTSLGRKNLGWCEVYTEDINKAGSFWYHPILASSTSSLVPSKLICPRYISPTLRALLSSSFSRFLLAAVVNSNHEVNLYGYREEESSAVDGQVWGLNSAFASRALPCFTMDLGLSFSTCCLGSVEQLMALYQLLQSDDPSSTVCWHHRLALIILSHVHLSSSRIQLKNQQSTSTKLWPTTSHNSRVEQRFDEERRSIKSANEVFWDRGVRLSRVL